MGFIYEVRAESDGRVHTFGARRTMAEAEALLRASEERVTAVGGRNDRYWVETIDTTGLFEPPSRPTPRERYTTRIEPITNPGAWDSTRVEVLDGDAVVGTYVRNYRMLSTFEPFRQGDRHYALIAPDYTATSVLDLATGEVVASEEPNDAGFCPVGFYVPDWWDVHDGSILPGSSQWRADHEWPNGDFGFVWGCIWGDDSSWKVQHLDLSRVSDGVIARDDRYGYVELATHPKLDPKEVIRCSSWDGQPSVRFAVHRRFDLSTGASLDEDPFA